MAFTYNFPISNHKYHYINYIPCGCEIENVDIDDQTDTFTRILTKTYICNDGTKIEVTKYYEFEDSSNMYDLHAVKIIVNDELKVRFEVIDNTIVKEFVYTDGRVTKYKYDDSDIEYNDSDCDDEDSISYEEDENDEENDKEQHNDLNSDKKNYDDHFENDCLSDKI